MRRDNRALHPAPARPRRARALAASGGARPPMRCAATAADRAPSPTAARRRRTPARRDYPADASMYELLDDCGRGVSATVRARAARPQLPPPAAAARPPTAVAVPPRASRAHAPRPLLRARPRPRPPRQVHRALCVPLQEIIAVKKMNLESMPCDLVRPPRRGRPLYF